MRTVEQRNEKKKEVMQQCFDCYSEYGLNNTNMKLLAKACNMSQGNLYVYFDTIDSLILESTQFCMNKIEGEIMNMVPESLDEIDKFIDEVPKINARKYGKNYRFLYQVYTSPKYYEEGKKYVASVTEKYKEYSKIVEKKLGISRELVFPLLLIFVRIIVHYALFEQDEYLKVQIDAFKDMARTLLESKNIK